MSIYSILTCVVKPEKQGEFMPLIQRYLKYKEEIFTQMFGNMAGAYVIMWEYASLADFEKVLMRLTKDEEWMKIMQELMLITDSLQTRQTYGTLSFKSRLQITFHTYNTKQAASVLHIGRLEKWKSRSRSRDLVLWRHDF